MKTKAFLPSLGRTGLWAIATLAIGGVSILTSFQPLWANIPFNIVAPILVLIFLKTVFFEKLKLSTLILMRALIVVAVLGFIPGPTYVTIVLAFLVINILEATLTDLKKGKVWNAVSGLALAASVFLFFGSTSAWIDPDSWYGPYYTTDARTELATVCWIIAYTIWNWLFVTHEFSPSIAFLHVGILAVPLVGMVAFADPGLWLIFRANSLTVGGVLQISCKARLEERLESKRMASIVAAIGKRGPQVALMILNLALIGAPLFLGLAR